MGMVQTATRHAAWALLVGAFVAVFVDAALQNALIVAAPPGSRSTVPWWVTGRVMERSTWIAAALLLWLVAPQLTRGVKTGATDEPVVLPAAALYALVGWAMLALPLVWILATWIIWIIKITLVGSWRSEGQIFVAGYYYINMLLNYLPWVAAGVAVHLWSRRAARDPQTA